MKTIGAKRLPGQAKKGTFHEMGEEKKIGRGQKKMNLAPNFRGVRRNAYYGGASLRKAMEKKNEGHWSGWETM